MTPHERETAQRAARIIRAARKQLGLTQYNLSKSLDISQSSLSKIEHGTLAPSLYEWFEFCRIAQLPAHCHVQGYIDLGRPLKLQSEDLPGTFRLPRKYLKLRGSSARSMLPFLRFFQTKRGEAKLLDYLKSVQVDSDYFVDLNHGISLEFCLDLTRQLIRDGVLHVEDLPEMVKPVNTPSVHGNIHSFYEESHSMVELVNALLSKARLYECNFDYQVEETSSSGNRIILSVQPEKHLVAMPYLNDPDLGDFLCRYKKQYFERFTEYGGKARAVLEELECHYHGAPRCVYQLTGHRSA